MYVVTMAYKKSKYKTFQKPDILKVFSFACRTEDIGLKRRTCPPFAGRLATLPTAKLKKDFITHIKNLTFDEADGVFFCTSTKFSICRCFVFKWLLKLLVPPLVFKTLSHVMH